MAAPERSAVIVPVPELDPVVGPHRRRLDPSATWGVPAHVTVVFPFAPPAAIDTAMLRALAAAVRTVDAFDCVFASTRWFGDDVVWVAPVADGPFRRLTAAVCAAFPAWPPYGGTFDDVVPHATVGERRGGSPAELRAAEQVVVPQLPVRARVERAVLMVGSDVPDSWAVVDTFPLGAAATRARS